VIAIFLLMGGMMEINMTNPVKVQAKTFKLHIKCRDGDLVDQDGQTLKEYEGYVPDFFPGEHYGDYLILDIDIDTGTITNWRKLLPSEIEDFIKGE
jgi:hypothetical protein